MLRLVDVIKSYKFGKDKCLVLDKINLDFKKQELVFILGKSGSGKSTLLNVIGGLLEVDSGSILLDDQEITKFSDRMLCHYRNNMVGHIFQEYHLVEYMSVVDNIKLAMTIHTNPQARIEEVLRQLGIYSKRNMKVNRLSGGEKQRVAIARAIINNPDILLCDEPTGALDSTNGIKIMQILKKISKDKLVIVVSHDETLAKEYADRIIRITDGKVDYIPQKDDAKFRQVEKKRISKFALFKLAWKNLGLKKGRTLFTSLAISLGFICILIVLCLSKSFNDDLDKLSHDVVSMFPIRIYNGDFEIADVEKPTKTEKTNTRSQNKIIRKKKSDYIVTNKIDTDYMNYVNALPFVSYINYEYDVILPMISDCHKKIDTRYMVPLSSNRFLEDNYDLLYGKNISSMYDIVLKVDSHNQVDEDILKLFNIETDIDYDALVGRKIRYILNDDYFKKRGEYYYIVSDYQKLFQDSNIELEIVGIAREKEVVDDTSNFYFSRELMDFILDRNAKSEIVVDQLKKDYNVLGLDSRKEELLSHLGYNTLPKGINIYVDSLTNKEKVIDALDAYNEENKRLVYIDTMSEAINLLKNVLAIITVLLVAFSTVSVVVAVQMVFILTNNRVMERVKEVGILRSLGARRGDITTLFNMENLVIGLISSSIGIGLTYLLAKPINVFVSFFLEDNGIFALYRNFVIIGFFLNIFIVVLSGYIPASVAGRKKIIDCLR